MATVATRKMKDEARGVLLKAVVFDHNNKGQWFRPKQIGGSATNNCARHLLALITRGFIERRDASAPGAWREKGIWEYRVTPAGHAELC